METTVAADDRFVAAEHLVEELLATGLPQPTRTARTIPHGESLAEIVNPGGVSLHLHFETVDDLTAWARRLGADPVTHVHFNVDDPTETTGVRWNMAWAAVDRCRIHLHMPPELVDLAAIKAEIAGPRLPVPGLAW